MNGAQDFITGMSHPLKFRLFLLSRLPAAFFSGVKVDQLTEESCTASVPYRWFTRNPFRSTYFACLAMAAEMSSGALAMAHLYNRKPAVSMLVTGFESSYHKKAVSRTFFTCNAGELFREAIEKTIATGEAQTVRAVTTGRSASGDLIAEAIITWSFLVRKK